MDRRKKYPILGFIRSKYLIDRDFQLRYSLMMIILFVISASAVGGVFAATVVQFRVQGDVEGGKGFLILLIVATVFFFLVIFGYGILIAHRISGPIFVMSQILDSLAEGKLPLTRPIRKGDELQGFFQRLLKAINYIRDREAEEAERLEETVRRLQTPSTSPEVNELLSGLSAMAARKRAFLTTPQQKSAN